MPSPSVLPGLDEAAEFLRSFDAATRKRGEHYYNSGRVISVQREGKLSHAYVAKVRGSLVYDVQLSYSTDDGWDGECTCPVSYHCKHTYAAMKALLAENSASRVAGLSSGTIVQKSAETSSLAASLEKSSNRPLAADERRFLRRLQEVYKLMKNRRSVWGWELGELGLRLPDQNRWPGYLESESNFWNYAALSTVRLGGSIPRFMEPVTDYDSIAEGLAIWERKLRIAEWQSIIEDVADSELSPAAPPVKYELRACFGKEEVHLEWSRPGMAGFEKIKPMQARSLLDDLRNFRVELSPEGHWVWEAFALRAETVGRTDVAYNDQYNLPRVARLFRVSAVRPILVNEEGKVFEWPEEPLRWTLEPAASQDDDYRLILTQFDGSRIPQLLLEVAGHPRLYVTREAVFRSPGAPEHLKPNAPNNIPAAALETKAGAALLMGLKVELPPRLRERVVTVPLELVLTCRLAESYPGSATEVCVISAYAAGPDSAVRATWSGRGWTQDDEETGERRSRQIVVADRTRLRDPANVVGSLGARWDAYAGTWNMRVSKKFPGQFVEWMRLLPPEVKVELHGELQSLTQQTVAGTLKLDVEEAGIDWFDLRVVLDVADTTLTQAEIKLLLNARGGFVRLKDKGWRRLEFNLSNEEDEQLARLGLNARELTGEPQRLHALQLADTAAKRFLGEPQFEKITRRVGELKARVTPPVPGSVRAELRPYQQEGFHFLAYLTENRFGGILADDMGLGKTVQTLTWLQWIREKNGSGTAPSLVVCPKSVMDNWRAETERFTPGIRVKIWTPDEIPKFMEKLQDYDLHVMNYNQLRLMGETLANTRWLAVILDEGQYIKNPSSITAQIARSLRADHRLVLSGTPIENKLLDLWSLMSFAMPGVLGSRAQFAKVYDAKEDPFARRRLSARVRPFLLRRTKSQVAKDLPERIEEDILCEIEGEQKTLYRAELKRAQQMLLRVQTQKQLAQERFHFLTSLLRLRQICCDPRLVKPDSKGVSAKVEALVEQLEPLIEEGQKVLVFSQFVQMLDLLRAEISGRDWPHFYLAGDTENRGELVSNFQNTEGPAVFLISLKAGGFGLNLTAASYVILFDPWWNPAVENQAIDRTHRIGQKQNVIAYRLLIKNSIEEKIRNLQRTKSALAEDVLGEERFGQSLTLQDLQFLFADE